MVLMMDLLPSGETESVPLETCTESFFLSLEEWSSCKAIKGPGVDGYSLALAAEIWLLSLKGAGPRLVAKESCFILEVSPLWVDCLISVVLAISVAFESLC